MRMARRSWAQRRTRSAKRSVACSHATWVGHAGMSCPANHKPRWPGNPSEACRPALQWRQGTSNDIPDLKSCCQHLFVQVQAAAAHDGVQLVAVEHVHISARRGGTAYLENVPRICSKKTASNGMQPVPLACTLVEQVAALLRLGSPSELSAAHVTLRSIAYVLGKTPCSCQLADTASSLEDALGGPRRDVGGSAGFGAVCADVAAIQRIGGPQKAQRRLVGALAELGIGGGESHAEAVAVLRQAMGAEKPRTCSSAARLSLDLPPSSVKALAQKRSQADNAAAKTSAWTCFGGCRPTKPPNMSPGWDVRTLAMVEYTYL